MDGKAILKRFVTLFKSNAFKIVLLAGLFITSALIIIAMLLGKEAGTFVIRVQDGDVNRSIAITLDNPEDPDAELTSKLNAPGIENFTDYNPVWFLDKDYVTLNEFTEETGRYLHGDPVNGTGSALYVYTFYLVNTSPASTVNVNVKLDISSVTKHLDDLARIMTYQVSMDGVETLNVYQKADVMPEGVTSWSELNKNQTGETWAYNGYIIPPKLFASKSVAFNDQEISLNIGEYCKYSVFFWLEGEDPDSAYNAERFYGATISFDLSFNLSMEVDA